jgi:hypothetical protein
LLPLGLALIGITLALLKSCRNAVRDAGQPAAADKR